MTAKALRSIRCGNTLVLDWPHHSQYNRQMEKESAKAKQGRKKRNMPVRRFPCPDELWAAAERVGNDEDRSVSWIIRKALEDYIEQHRAAKRAAKEAAFERDLERPAVQHKSAKRNSRG